MEEKITLCNGKVISKDSLFDAMVSYNGDPFLVEEENDAEALFKDIDSSGYNYHVLTEADGYDFEVACNQLDMTEANHVKQIYEFDYRFLVCFPDDYDLAPYNG